jgi:tetratricopeptide (TPR) repeat protein
MFGLPPGQDMDGKVLLTAFKEPPPTNTIESWDKVPGNAGLHSAEAQIDPIASAEAFKQLVELGYVAPPGPNAQETVNETVRELKYNLARSYRDGDCCGEAAAIAEELWQQWPKEHRFGILLIESLGPLRQIARRRQVIEELGRRIERYAEEAKADLARRKEATPPKDQAPTPAFATAQTREQFEERQLRELASGRPTLVEWYVVSQALLEGRHDEARRHLQKLMDADAMSHGLSLRVAGALAELGEFEDARGLLQASLEVDSDNPAAHAQLAGIHFKAKRFPEAISAATASLSLLYFQPGLHALLGHALMEIGRLTDAEKELKVAVAQSPRNLAAHDLLAKLYRQLLERPADAFIHEGKAQSLRNELTAQQQVSPGISGPNASPVSRGISVPQIADSSAEVKLPCPPPWGAHVDLSQVITVVSGLPRSGTSMMMQILQAGGRDPLTDNKRTADEDNPLGYFEFEKTLELARDTSWVPQARGKVIKIVAQLLPFLPRDEHYNVLLMERDLAEVISSQRVMLARQGRQGTTLEEERLKETFLAQMNRVRSQIRERPELRILTVNFAELLATPAAGVERIAHFLGGAFDQAAAIRSVRPELRRQHSQNPSVS